MTKEQFWEKWIVQAYGGHVPVRLLLKKEKFLNDLDLIIECKKIDTGEKNG